MGSFKLPNYIINSLHETDTNLTLSSLNLEELYQLEQELLTAIARGDAETAHALHNLVDFQRSNEETYSELRFYKNTYISLNTLIHYTLYQKGIPPALFENFSAYCVYLLEKSTTIEEINDTAYHMIQTYCEIARQHTTSNFSKAVSQILITISLSIDGNLSLNRFATDLYMNPSYLSALFKKEVGMPLSSYVNNARIKKAAQLLRSTKCSIQDVATSVGISDIHYFSRLFHREMGMSPSKYRTQKQ